MIETTLLGIGILVLMATWRWMARPTYLDQARDQLFDLRDDCVRPFFLRHEKGLHHPQYIALRNLINGHLRYTESVSLLGFVAMVIWMSRNVDAARVLQSRHEAVFDTDEIEVQKFSEETRRRATWIMLGYAIKTSLIGRTVLLVFSMRSIMSTCWASLKGLALGRIPLAAVTAASVATMSGIAAHLVPEVGASAAQSALEERALQQV
ncbi:hypothetical protein ACRS2S_19700 [Achromobacter xylosoxidans]|uniref:hypothetical protein n=1 Tax=Alcaligenes xylosoxydans xylosoxydans TaxID=85698 RepID=UPI003EE173E3